MDNILYCDIVGSNPSYTITSTFKLMPFGKLSAPSSAKGYIVPLLSYHDGLATDSICLYIVKFKLDNRLVYFVWLICFR